MSHSHAVVWMDFKEAHVYRFDYADVEKKRIRARNPWRKVHHKAGAIGSGHAHNDKAFFDEIVEGLKADDFEILEDGKPQTIDSLDFIRFDTFTPEAVRRNPSSPMYPFPMFSCRSTCDPSGAFESLA